LGRPVSDILKDPDAWMQSIHPDDIAVVRRALEESERTGVYRATYRVVHKDGAMRTIVDEGHRVTASDGCRYILGVARDLGRSMTIERKLTRAEQLRGLAALCGGVANDYNNILASVSSAVQLALSQVAEDSPTAATLRPIRRELDRAAELTSRLAGVAGKGSFEFATVAIATEWPLLNCVGIRRRASASMLFGARHGGADGRHRPASSAPDDRQPRSQRRRGVVDERRIAGRAAPAPRNRL
jgi:hypothetical protein